MKLCYVLALAIATDIYRIANGRIVENWHLEDNLTLLQQLGAVGQ